MNDAAREPGAPPDRHLLGRWTPWIVVVVLLAVVGVVVATWRESGRDRKPADLDPAFVYDVDRFKDVPPEKIGYREAARVETGLQGATALAVGPGDEIVVGGDERVLVFASTGARLGELAVDEAPLCLAVAADGVLYAGSSRAVARGPLAGPLEPFLEVPGEKARLTSIAVGKDSLFVADMGARAVWRFGRDGRERGRIGLRDDDRNVPGFVVPSPYFDVLVAPDGLLRIVDPGRHRISAFTTDGYLELSWGEASFALEGFSGCCNPSHIAMLPDGRVVTSEKGLARVKVHDAHGRFETAVVGPAGLDTETGPCDVAVDSDSRILVLDPGRGVVRIFVPKTDGRSARDD
jgi:sugar lactone lactonase YvrE